MSAAKGRRSFISGFSRKTHQDAGLAMVLILLLLGYFLDKLHFFYWAIPVVLITMTAPILLAPFTCFWMTLSKVLGRIMSTLILSTIFLALVLPVGLVRRLLGYDPLKLKAFGRSRGSALIDRDITFTGTDMEQPY